MNANRVTLLLMLTGGCGSNSALSPDDASLDEPHSDAVATKTLVAGSINGQEFVLRYSAIKRSTSDDPRTWLCAANVAVTYADCERPDTPDRIMLLGPFTYGGDGNPKWALVQLGLYRVGANAVIKFAESGTLNVVDDPDSDALHVSLEVDVGEMSPTNGTIAIPP